jgi:hypothetical protein
MNSKISLVFLCLLSFGLAACSIEIGSSEQDTDVDYYEDYEENSNDEDTAYIDDEDEDGSEYKVAYTVTTAATISGKPAPARSSSATYYPEYGFIKNSTFIYKIDDELKPIVYQQDFTSEQNPTSLVNLNGKWYWTNEELSPDGQLEVLAFMIERMKNSPLYEAIVTAETCDGTPCEALSIRDGDELYYYNAETFLPYKTIMKAGEYTTTSEYNYDVNPEPINGPDFEVTESWDKFYEDTEKALYGF